MWESLSSLYKRSVPSEPVPSPSSPEPQLVVPAVTDKKEKDNSSTRFMSKSLPLVLGSLALIGFSSLLFTVVRKTPKEHAVSLKELLQKNPKNSPEMESKLSAYMFAGRAFATATGLVGTGSLVLGTGLVYAFELSSFHDLSNKLKGFMRRQFPSLRGSYTEQDEQEALVSDQDSLDFLSEWTREVNAPPPPPSQMESLLRSKVRAGLPLDTPSSSASL